MPPHPHCGAPSFCPQTPRLGGRSSAEQMISKQMRGPADNKPEGKPELEAQSGSAPCEGVWFRGRQWPPGGPVQPVNPPSLCT